MALRIPQVSNFPYGPVGFLVLFGGSRLPGQPIGKRDAEADPAWHSGFRRLPGQPIGKRDAEADPAWHSGFRRLPGQPIGKRDVEEETEAVVEDEE
ncbi:hypothetical protein SLS60_000758 [Paraconiothyrium brasiliense]|uniref:Uncharacterized protein n=1 Tax=Paraconiothyrium brasiliense TaxID=300254 RepID=A0ABR3S754_9PLEO